MKEATKKPAAKAAAKEAPKKTEATKVEASKAESTKTEAKKSAPAKAAPAKDTASKSVESKGAETKSAAPKSAAPKSAAKSAPAKRDGKKEGQSAFAKPLKPSKELSTVVGHDPLPRTEVVKKVWDYIKKHDLQNAENKREIVADANLKAVFGRDKVTMFEMNKLLAAHLS